MQFQNLTRHTEIGANSYLLELGGKSLILDAGLHPRAEGGQALPRYDLLAPDSIDAVFLTHSHQDHLGSLPLLLRQQGRAQAFMTEATRQLSDVMLHNSVNVMTRVREDHGILDYPLFTHREVDQCERRWQARPIRQPFTIEGERAGAHGSGDAGDVTFEFHEAGHVLGAAGVLLRGEGRTVFYTGDVHFDDQTVSRAAQFPESGVDVLVIETTRGDHPVDPAVTRASEEQRLADALREAFSRGGCVLMPIFALGKTQELLTMFHQFRRRGLLGGVPIYIGGLSTKLTEIYDRLHHAAPRLHPDLQILDAVAPFVLAGRSLGEPPINKARIYALSSGMMTPKTLSNAFGRRLLSDATQSIFFVGYADPISPAGILRAAKPGDMVQLDPQEPAQVLRCKVEKFDFSGHAPREKIRAYVNRLRPAKVVLVHGDPGAIDWFRTNLSADLPGSEIIVPEPGVRFEL